MDRLKGLGWERGGSGQRGACGCLHAGGEFGAEGVQEACAGRGRDGDGGKRQASVRGEAGRSCAWWELARMALAFRGAAGAPALPGDTAAAAPACAAASAPVAVRCVCCRQCSCGCCCWSPRVAAACATAAAADADNAAVAAAAGVAAVPLLLLLLGSCRCAPFCHSPRVFLVPLSPARCSLPPFASWLRGPPGRPSRWQSFLPPLARTALSALSPLPPLPFVPWSCPLSLSCLFLTHVSPCPRAAPLGFPSPRPGWVGAGGAGVRRWEGGAAGWGA